MNAHQLLRVGAHTCLCLLATLAASQAGEDSNATSVLKTALLRCWTIPASASFTEVFQVQFRLNEDGSLAGEPTVIAHFRRQIDSEVEQSTIRAIKKCAPFRDLSRFADSYENWREVTVKFDLREVSRP